MQDRYKVAEIEAAADVVVWSCDEAPGFTPAGRRTAAFVGNIVEAMIAYQQGKLGAQAHRPVARSTASSPSAPTRMMAAVAARATSVLKPYLKPEHRAIGSINSPMQCMMKEICAQCLQPHRDPETGKRDDRVLLLQPGPAARPGRFPRAARPPAARTACRRS